MSSTTLQSGQPADPLSISESASEKRIRARVEAEMKSQGIPGMTVAAKRNGKTVFSKAYGHADVAAGKAMTTDTRARIGSVSKATVTGPSGYQALAKARLSIDAKIYGAGGVLAGDFADDIAIHARRWQPAIDMDIGAEDRVYTWYRNGTYTIGASTDLNRHEPAQPFKLPPGFAIEDLVAVSINASGKVYSWWDNARVDSTDSPKLRLSIGKVSDLGSESKGFEDTVSLPAGSGLTVFNIVGMAIAKSSGRVYTWFDNGTVSVGTATDLDAHEAPKPYQLPPGIASYHVRGMAISQDDNVYGWYSNAKASCGSSTHLASRIPLYDYEYIVPSPGASHDLGTWFNDITARHLYDHRAGFTRSGDAEGAAAMFGGTATTVKYREIHRHFLRTRKLLGAPGSVSSYSNHGFGVWTLMIEKLSKKAFRDYVREEFLGPLGLAEEIVPNSAQPAGRDSVDYTGDGKGGVKIVPPANAGTGLAAGGFRASALGLTRLTSALRDAYTPSQMNEMGWGGSDKKLSHNGLLGGGMAHMTIFGPGSTDGAGNSLDGLHVAVVANCDRDVSALSKLVDAIADELTP